MSTEQFVSRDVKTYLGDGVYAEYDGYQIHIFTSDGYTETSGIYLEPAVVESLFQYVKKLKEK